MNVPDGASLPFPMAVQREHNNRLLWCGEDCWASWILETGTTPSGFTFDRWWPSGGPGVTCMHCHQCGTILAAPDVCAIHDECPSSSWVMTTAAVDVVHLLQLTGPWDDGVPDDAIAIAEDLSDRVELDAPALATQAMQEWQWAHYEPDPPEPF